MIFTDRLALFGMFVITWIFASVKETKPAPERYYRATICAVSKDGEAVLNMIDDEINAALNNNFVMRNGDCIGLARTGGVWVELWRVVE